MTRTSRDWDVTSQQSWLHPLDLHRTTFHPTQVTLVRQEAHKHCTKRMLHSQVGYDADEGFTKVDIPSLVNTLPPLMESTSQVQHAWWVYLPGLGLGNELNRHPGLLLVHQLEWREREREKSSPQWFRMPFSWGARPAWVELHRRVWIVVAVSLLFLECL